MKNLKWSDFKQFVDKKNLSIQTMDFGDRIDMTAHDAALYYSCTVNKDDEEDYLEYQTSYEQNKDQPLEQRGENGHVIYAPTFEDDQGLTGNFKGHLFVAQPNQLNLFDVQVTAEMKLRGGWYQIFSSIQDPEPSIGDYIEVSIIDKDDILGLFAVYGIPQGHYIELNKFVKTDYVNPFDNTRQNFLVSGGSTVYQGLYIRFHYHNTGNTPVNFSAKVYSHDS